MTADAYRQALHRWAAQRVPEGAAVTKVTVNYSEGRVWSEWTIEDPYLHVDIDYTLNGHPDSVTEDEEDVVQLLTGMARLLNELFAIEEDE